MECLMFSKLTESKHLIKSLVVVRNIILMNTLFVRSKQLGWEIDRKI